jgi:PAS domain S-box-containing protein
MPVFLIGTYVFARNPEKTVARVFLFFSLAGTLIALSEFEMIISDNAEIARGWLRFHFALWPVLFAGQLHFLSVYTKTVLFKNTSLIYFFYAAALVVSVNSFINISYHDIVEVRFGYIRDTLEDVESPSQVVYAGFMTLLILLITLTGIMFVKKTTNIKNEKVKAILIIAGLLVPTWMPLIKNAFFPMFNLAVFFPDFPFFFIGWICFALAIWRFDMFDITTKTVADKIVSTMTEALMLVDEDGVIISVNKAFYRLFEFEKKEITGQSVYDFFKRSPNAQEKLGATYKNEEVKNCICMFDTKDKKGAQLIFSVSFLKNRKQDVVGYVFIMSDISELAEAEYRLQKQQENMIEIAHQAGMAEIASNTMHNIGNILNSVNISSEHFISTLEKMKINEFKKANDLVQANRDKLQDFFTIDETGKFLPEYIGHIIDDMEEQNNALKTESKRLAEKIRLIEDNIAAQQAQTKQKTINKNRTGI